MKKSIEETRNTDGRKLKQNGNVVLHVATWRP